jgi:hypothetical protein
MWVKSWVFYALAFLAAIALVCGARALYDWSCDGRGGHTVISLRGDPVCVNDEGEKL